MTDAWFLFLIILKYKKKIYILAFSTNSLILHRVVRACIGKYCIINPWCIFDIHNESVFLCICVEKNKIKKSLL